MRLKKTLITTVTGTFLIGGSLLIGNSETVQAEEDRNTEGKAHYVEAEWVARSPEEIEIVDPANYEIQWGDTLWAISLASGVSIDALVERNDIANRDLIYAGDSLTIEGSSVNNTNEETTKESYREAGRTGDGAVHEEGDQGEEAETSAADRTEEEASDLGEPSEKETESNEEAVEEESSDIEQPEASSTPDVPEETPSDSEESEEPDSSEDPVEEPTDPEQSEETETPDESTEEPTEPEESEAPEAPVTPQEPDEEESDQEQSEEEPSDPEQSEETPENPEEDDSDSSEDESEEESDPNATDADRLLQLVNDARADAGLSELSYDAELNDFATFRVNDMAENNYFSHDSPIHGPFSEMVEDQGLMPRGPVGENILQGTDQVDLAFEGWMDSPGHRDNILNGDYNYFGLAYEPNGNYWVQVFSAN